MNINLHDAIDKVAEKAKPAIDLLAQSAHTNVERLAFRTTQLEDTYQRFFRNQQKLYTKASPYVGRHELGY